MLDNCSQDSFIHDNLVKELGDHGMKTTLNLKTLHGEKTESTMVVEFIKLTGMSGDSSLLPFPKLYTRREISVDRKKLQLRIKSRNGNI